LQGIEEQIVLFLQNLFQTMGWPGVVLAMAIESACIPLPSEVTMPLAGWMLVQAQGLGQAFLLAAAFWGAVGNTIGSVITYWVGALGGRPLLEKYGKYILISKRDMDLADRWFARWGEPTAFFSRMLPVVRTFISLPAGIARMNFVRFTVLTFIGSFIWSGLLAWAGFVFGEHWREVREAMRPFDIPIIIVVLMLAALYVYRHLKHAREDSAPAPEA
jgi:membrane protein DedA with SNARE-associated domain